jgi:hypothetical protein
LLSKLFPNMSTVSVSIIPKRSSYPDKENKANEILEWLIARDIVQPNLSDCILSSSHGYAISDGATKISIFPDQLPFGMLTNGLEIVTKRQVFDTAENWIDKLLCPNCNENIAFYDWDLDAWYAMESDNFSCPLCKHVTDIHQFTFEPDWGFSDLGFKFWNWTDFTADFINEFKKKLNCEISIVHQHI